MPDALRIIQLLVAPVVMISACGLLCLALYNRLAAIVTRARTFDKERFDEMGHLASLPMSRSADATTQQMHRRMNLLDDQVSRILKRARLVRGGLIFLLITVLCMLACSLALGVSLVVPGFSGVALALFLVGVTSSLVAVGQALLELARALDPVELEERALSEMKARLERRSLNGTLPPE